MNAYQLEQPSSTKGYARTLYENYRARMISAGQFMPKWDNVSATVKREFVREARQLLM